MDLRATTLRVDLSKGVARTVRLRFRNQDATPADLSSVQLVIGGGMRDMAPVDLDDDALTVVDLVAGDPGVWETALVLDTPGKFRLRLLVNGAVEAAGRVSVKTSTAATPDTELVVLLGDLVLDFMLVGAPGAAGADGEDGPSAYQVAVNNGFVGDETAWLASLKGANGEPGADGADGESGEDGLSAYQIAVNGGFVGNEAAWLASLKGEQGEPGSGVDLAEGDGISIVVDEISVDETVARTDGSIGVIFVSDPVNYDPETPGIAFVVDMDGDDEPVGLVADNDPRLPPTPVGQSDGRMLAVSGNAWTVVDAPTGGGAALPSIVPVGAYASQPGPYTTGASTLIAEGRATWSALWVPAGTWDAIGVWVTTTTAAVLRLCLDTMSATTGLPTALVSDAGTVDCSTVTGMRLLTFASPVVRTEPGWLWGRVVNTTATSPTLGLLNAAGGCMWPPGIGAGGGFNNRATSGVIGQNQATGASEQPAPGSYVLSDSSTPRVWLRRSA